MSHELTITNAKAEMAYVGAVPWHGLGQALPAGAPIAAWLDAAGMNWTIRKSKVHYFADRAQRDLRVDDDAVVLVRSDNGERLGIVSPDYEIVQPYEAFDFFRDLVSDHGFEIHTAGTLFGGKRFWALAKMDEAELAGWDKIGGYYLLSSSADGMRATEGRETTVRVVCNNTLSMALGSDGVKHGFKLSHRNRFDYKAVHAQLEITRDHFQAFVEAANTLTKVKANQAAAEAFINQLLRPTDDAAYRMLELSPVDSLGSLLNRPFTAAEDSKLGDAPARRPRGADTILDLFLGGGIGSERKGSAGTAWGVVNAVTEYVDYHAIAKTPDHLLDRALWGSGGEVKSAALASALTFAW